MTSLVDALQPSANVAAQAWAARVRANREQVEQFREATPADFYAPTAGLFRADPRRTDDRTLDLLRELVHKTDTVLDIGAGGGRYALPLALECREVIAIEPSPGMLGVLRDTAAEFSVANVRLVEGRWPSVFHGLTADVSLMAHVGYDIEEIGPFLEAMEGATRRLCIAVLLGQAPPTEADRLWPAIHGVERASLPALREFLHLLLARGRLCEVRLVERTPQSYADPAQLLGFLRQQLWTAPDSDKDRRLQAILHERMTERQGRYALSWQPVRIGIVSWSP